MSGLEYLLISQFFICVMLALVFFVVWKTVDRQPYVLCFCFIYILGLVAGFFNALVSSIPSHDWYWIAYAAVFQVILGMLLAAVRMRADKPYLKPWHWVLLVGTQLMVMWFTLVQPHVGMQMAVVPYCAAWVLLLSAQQVRQTHAEVRLADWWASVFMVVYAIALVGSGTAALLQGADFDTFYLEWYNRFTFLVQPAAFSGIGLFIVLMLADGMALKMQNLSITDQLTELLNRRGYENAVERIVAYTRRRQSPLAVVVADLDNFKQINDRYSHHIGDVALQKFANNARKVLRKEDIIARIGGEEFAILLIETPQQEAQQVVERLRLEVRNTPVQVSKTEQLVTTCSFGMVMLNDRHNDIFSAMREADAALYEAKRAGRDQLKIYQPT